MKRRTLILMAGAIMLLSFPVSGIGQDYNDRYPSDYRANRYDSRSLKESVKRVDKLSGQLKSDIDRALDRSRLDGRRSEDRINELANDFHSAAAQFKDKFDDGSDPDGAEREARRVLDLGFQLDRLIDRNRLDRRVESKWSQVVHDLQLIRDAYYDRSAYDYRY